MNSSAPLISIVSPVYMAEGIIPELIRRIEENLKIITDNCEIILVDDCSPDNSWNEILVETKKNPSIKAIKLSKNFGQHFAITAGLDHANGDWVIVMDCDLQDRPEEIPAFYKKAIEGYDIVMGKRTYRTDGVLKKFFSYIFYSVFNYLTEIKQDSSIANFGIYSKKVVKSLSELREPNRSFSLFARWVGFNITYIQIEHGKRALGSSSYNLNKLLKLAINIIVSYSNKPLYMTIKTGFLLSLISMFTGMYYFIIYLNGMPIQGYTSLIISIWFLGGLTIFFLGVIGLYISKIFDSVKFRPLYIIDKKINLK